MLMKSPEDIFAQPPRPNDPHRDLPAAASSVIEIIKRRWKTLAAVSLGLFAVACVLILLIPPKYLAVARLKIDPTTNIGLGQSGVSQPDQSVIDTEVSVMRSRDIAQAVASKLDLAHDQVFMRGMPAMPAPPTPADVAQQHERIVGRLMAGLDVERDKYTFIVNVGYLSPQAALSARVANAFARAYIDNSVEMRTGTASQQTAFFDKRLAALGEQAAAADSKLAQYRAQAGITHSGDSTVTDEQVNPLATQLADAESEAAAASSRVSMANAQISQGGIGAVSAVLNSPVIADLRKQRAELIQQQGEIQTRYGPKHPQSIKIAEQLTALDQQIADEARRTIGGLQSEAGAANARAGSLRSDMARLRGQQAVDTQASAIADGYQRQADAAHAAYNRLAEQAQASTQVARSSLSQAQVIEDASPPVSPSSPKLRLLLVAALVAALFAGLASVAAQELLSKGLRSVGQVEALGIPVLASIPKLGGRQLRGDAGVTLSPAELVLAKPMSAYAEAFRVLRRGLMGSDGEQRKTIAIVSTLPAEGKTNSSLSLARIMGLSGEKTLIIDTDLRRAALRGIAGVEAGPGLVEILRDGVAAETVIQRDVAENVDILPVAAPTFLSEDLFSGQRMAELIGELEARYDRIIIDTAPLLGVADARSIASLAQAVVLIVKFDATPRNAVRTALGWLASDKAHVVGALLTMVDASSEAYGAMYYSRKYAQYYRAE